jgi:hypothetical protein
MATESDRAIEPKPRVRLSAALLAVYLAIVAWAFYEQATAWPHVGSWAVVAYVFLCPGIVFQSCSLAYAWRTGRALKRRWLVRLGTIPLGLVLAAMLASWTGVLSLRGLEQAYAPLVVQLAATLPDPCGAASSHFQAPAVVAYNRRTGRDRPVAKLHHDVSRFVLAFRGGSLDIDGSTFFYDSASATWRIFHNDDDRGRADYDKLTSGLVECLVQGAS